MAQLVITTGQEVVLHVAAAAPVGIEVPPAAPVVWSTADATKVALAPIGGDPNSILCIGIAVNASTTITATNGVLTQTFTIQTVDPAATAFVITNDTPTDQQNLQKSRGRGLGLGYA